MQISHLELPECLSGPDPLITVINLDGQKLTPCVLDRAWREVNRARAVWIDEQTIQLLYNPFLYRDYRKAALKRDHYTCLWCGRSATTVDHIVPSSKGGSDLPQNLLASCMECNTKRGNRSAFSYLLEKAFLVPNHLKLCYRITKAKYNHRQTNRCK
ncbi:HNH endonuclease [Paenibacillus montanisoli]|uniref:HNH endonuclease n=2 Tax=Paenibacillus montanisoli TaxID=2081970 RepID=A0A328TWD8_9BACL|nr:HNH endonuclease [Paenibacillus montanisoli]RAP74809.1 HNH endonuclease [Paenibacillus montanisoli]